MTTVTGPKSVVGITVDSTLYEYKADSGLSNADSSDVVTELPAKFFNSREEPVWKCVVSMDASGLGGGVNQCENGQFPVEK